MSTRVDDAPAGRRRRFNLNWLGAGLLVIALGASLWNVMRIQEELFDPNKTILRISHWQLESGYRDALQTVIDDYERIQKERFGRNVEIIQIPVTERLYPQWLNTHLISGTAPDIAEMGKSKLSGGGSDDQYTIRYFLPLSGYIDEPNPYNAGTPLEGQPWQETMLDGFRGGYKEALQDYYAATTTFWVVRIFYNKTLLREVTGSDTPPATLEELIELGKRIRQYGKEHNRPLVPILGSDYNANMYLWHYDAPFTTAFESTVDSDWDGWISEQETYVAAKRGQVSMHSPEVVAFYDAMHELFGVFNEGFRAVDRQSAAFAFVQGNAVMMGTGSWDYRSLAGQLKQNGYEVGVFAMPMPAKNGKWGKYVAGRISETVNYAGSYGVYKFSHNQDLAIDFLRYLTSLKVNERFNQETEWPPATVGAKPNPAMAAFAVDPRGFNSALRWRYGADSRRQFEGSVWPYLQGQIPYEQFAKTVEAALLNPDRGGQYQWGRDYYGTIRWTRNQERLLAVESLRYLMEPSATDAKRKHDLALLQQVRRNNGEGLRWRFEQVHGQPIPKE